MKYASENNNNAFFDFFTTIEFDKNKNISKSDESDLSSLMSLYHHNIRDTVLPYLNIVFLEGIKSGLLTYENFISFLIEESWIGIPYKKRNLPGNEIVTDWIRLIIPSISEFFLQIRGWQSSAYYKPSFVLCVDSLTPKLEGLLRNFCERVEIPTSVSRPKGMQEVYVHNVLDHPTIHKYFNQDDLLFFKYLFNNEGGINLRNNVAHSFYIYEEYSQNQMILLLACLLRLAKYQAQPIN